MKPFFTSKLVALLSISILSVLFTAVPVQAIPTCCCCSPPTCYTWATCPTATQTCIVLLDPLCTTGNTCLIWCQGQMAEVIESFMPDEYVDEVIAMDEECKDEVDEVAEE